MQRTGKNVEVGVSPQGVKFTARDSVFSDLFSIPKYQLQLYRALHPEDTRTTIDDIKLCTLKNVVTNGRYNDLGLQVGDRQIILVESQTKWSVNILWRVFFYLSETYDRFFTDRRADLFSPKKVSAPQPELYLLYIGNRRRVPEKLSLRQEFFPDQDSLDLTLTVLASADGNDVVAQYVKFSKTVARYVKEYGKSRETLERIIAYCLSHEILVDYLEERKSEVMSIMTHLFDQEYWQQIWVENERAEAEARGEARGEAKARLADMKRIKLAVSSGKLTLEEASEIFGYSISEIESALSDDPN